MGRIQLFEFEDLKWFPSFLRDYMTDFLQFLANNTNFYKPILPLLEKGLKKNNVNQIVDLGSGGGGGLIWINEELKKNNPKLKILLTDYFPNIDAFENTKKQSDNIDYIKTSVDAMNIPMEINGLRTMFLLLHHFKPEDALKILQNAVDSNNSIAIFEAQERSVLSLISLLFSPLGVLLTTPFIKPFKIGRLFFTYIIPLVPFFIMWDGIISALRTYSVIEMEELISNVSNNDNFDWEIGRLKSGHITILYLLGTKKPAHK